MASSGSLAGPLRFEPHRALRTRLLVRVWAFVAGPSLDAELADGVSPTASILLGARADWITRPRACRLVAQVLRGAVEAAEQPPNRSLSSRVPVEADAVELCADEVLALAERLTTIERPSAFGVAIARQLAFDGRSPLLLQAPAHRDGAGRRLASTVDAAHRALSVSADFDRISASSSSNPKREESQMTADVGTVAGPQGGHPETAAGDRGVGTVDSGLGQRDLMLGLIVGCVMALSPIAVAIIISLT